MDITPLGKLLILVGLVITGLGILLLAGGKVPWLGRLPGDILIRGKEGTFYFPLMTCLVISVVVSLVLFFLKNR